MSAEIPVFVKSGKKVEQGSTYITKIEELLLFMEDHERMDRVRCDFEGIQKFLAHATGAKIPQSLAESLGFLDQKWQMVYSPYKPNSIPYLFLGTNVQFDHMIRYKDAISTIHLDRDLGKGNMVSDFKRIRLAGVDDDTGRVVAVNYNAGCDKYLFCMDVSVPEVEILLPPYERLAKVFCSIGSMPTPIKHPFWNSGLITEAMVQEVCDESFMSDKTLKAVVAGKDGNRLDIFGDFYNSMEGLGYYTKTHVDSYEIGFNPQGIILEDIVPWEVSVPKTLDKTLKARIFSF